MLSMEQIRGILSEQHAEDLPVAAHMQLWSTDDIRRYAEAGGFWSPEAQSAAAETQEAPLGWETYEAHAISLDSPGGEALAAAMSDGWAIRCAQITSAFEPQVRVRLTAARACTRAQPCKRAPSCLLISTGAGTHPKPRNPPSMPHVTSRPRAAGAASPRSRSCCVRSSLRVRLGLGLGLGLGPGLGLGLRLGCGAMRRTRPLRPARQSIPARWPRLAGAGGRPGLRLGCRGVPRWVGPRLRPAAPLVCVIERYRHRRAALAVAARALPRLRAAGDHRAARLHALRRGADP